MEILRWVLLGIIALTSVLTIFFVLLNKGKGGGLSDMFGGGMTSSLNSSGVASRNLVRLTVTTAIIWVLAIIGYALFLRFTAV
ncbi:MULTISPECIES: preprotein translocase subunit SecG [Kocuria]|uniref:preprotein translocase subunit SecG n=1 Tax=Kocuria TaxID=57493 RepID=UPI0006612E4E|nr:MULTISPECIES: preprotein translocase subunit SecG [Kocuria]MCT1368493.1 preprotein translocase subunit SecG [Rothia sp. p3-SID1597]RUQ22555.1 preprotein translocase subunit SecG [Kocuria sp. HSID16901]